MGSASIGWKRAFWACGAQVRLRGRHTLEHSPIPVGAAHPGGPVCRPYGKTKRQRDRGRAPHPSGLAASHLPPEEGFAGGSWTRPYGGYRSDCVVLVGAGPRPARGRPLAAHLIRLALLGTFPYRGRLAGGHRGPPLRLETDRWRWLSKGRRRRGTASKANFAHPGPQWGRKGTQASIPGFARRNYCNIFQEGPPTGADEGASVPRTPPAKGQRSPLFKLSKQPTVLAAGWAAPTR